MAAWLAWLAIHTFGGALRWTTIVEPVHLWHAHEMIFGFAAAAIAGFLLTAVPNWTGTLPRQGWPLAVLFGLWCAGRVAMWVSAALPLWLVSAIDFAFLPALGLVIARQLAVSPARHNVLLVSVIGVLAAANGWYHLDRLGLTSAGMVESVRFGVHLLIVMVAVIGGRVVPSFTRNVLARRGAGARLPVLRPRLNLTGNALVALTAALVILPAPDGLRGAVALAAGIANGLRLAGWRGQDTLSEPLLWVLHLGYLWLVAGLLLSGISLLTGWISEAAALHGLSAGAVGTMVLAIMTRASLGHTGRPLVAQPPVAFAYLLVSIAAVLRVFGPAVAPAYYGEIMVLAALGWVAAFTIFSMIYAPILLRPRV
jgi:uncharacterized protein involved in response to NO